MEQNKLRPLSLWCLWDGLLLKEDIFNYNGQVLLLPKGTVIQRSQIEKLKNFNSGNSSIMVYDSTYREIMESGQMTMENRHEMIEEYVDYSTLQHSISDVFSNADDASWLSDEKLKPLVQMINEKVTNIDPAMIFSCIDFPRPMDVDLQRHSLNVAFLNGLIGRWMGLEQDTIYTLVLAGLLHDVGKTKIPEEILNAPRKLTKEEFDIMKTHPVYSEMMIGSSYNKEVRQIVRWHHEKLDGSGYPDGISGEQIPLLVRITSISDIYDAMVSKRIYKAARLPLAVFDQFYNQEFSGLDRALVSTFLWNMRTLYTNRPAIMSDGNRGVIRYIPANDSEHPVVEQNDRIRQTDGSWYCSEILISHF